MPIQMLLFKSFHPLATVVNLLHQNTNSINLKYKIFFMQCMLVHLTCPVTLRKAIS